MKKWMTALLVAMMCISLCACGNSEAEAKYEKYKTLIDALENEDYEGAVMEIYKLYEANQGGEAETNEQGEAVEQTTTADANKEMWQAQIPGEWLAYSYDEDVELDDMVFNEDGTCVINGESLTWEVENAYETDARVLAKNGEKSVYRISLSRHYDYGYYYANLGVMNEDGSSTSTNATYYYADDYTVLELTADSIMDYFEVEEVFNVRKNSFGEMESIDVYRYLVLKEEFGRVNPSLSHVAVEYSYDNFRQMVTVDVDTKTYELGEITYEYNTSTNTTRMNTQHLDDVERYGLSWGSFYVDEFPQDEVSTYANYKIERLLGTVYCLK